MKSFKNAEFLADSIGCAQSSDLRILYLTEKL